MVYTLSHITLVLLHLYDHQSNTIRTYNIKVGTATESNKWRRRNQKGIKQLGKRRQIASVMHDKWEKHCIGRVNVSTCNDKEVCEDNNKRNHTRNKIWAPNEHCSFATSLKETRGAIKL